MNIDHIGIVVKSLQKSIAHWEKIFGYSQQTDIVENSRQKVRVVFLKKNGSLSVKLVEPVGEDSPVYRFAKKGGGLHHLCFKCDNVMNQVGKMKEMELRVLSPPQPGEAFMNEDIAFLFAKQGLNIELIDTEKRAGIIHYKERCNENIKK